VPSIVSYLNGDIRKLRRLYHRQLYPAGGLYFLAAGDARQY
jgi:hypothetical protein